MNQTMLEYSGDVLALRAAFAAYPSGLAAIGARIDDEDVLMIASSFTVGVSYDPPLCSVAIQNTSTTWPRLRGASRLGVSALAADHADHVARLGSRNSAGRLDSVGSNVIESGSLLLDGAVAWFDCSIDQEIAAGDHAIVLLRVEATATTATADAPLVLHRGGLHGTRLLTATV